MFTEPYVPCKPVVANHTSVLLEILSGSHGEDKSTGLLVQLHHRAYTILLCIVVHVSSLTTLFSQSLVELGACRPCLKPSE